MDAELILWTAGSQPATKSKDNNLPFPTTDKGTIKTFDTLQVVGNPRVFALGDLAGAAQEQQENLPATAQASASISKCLPYGLFCTSASLLRHIPCKIS